MEAPDKIYVSIRDLQNGYTTDICLSQEKGYSAYIRKEALVEWINKKLQESADRLDYMTNKAYAEIFDKLNSM